MDAPMFVLHPPRSTLPYRDRRPAARGAQRFTLVGAADGEPFELLVHDAVRDEVRRLAERAHPNEWFGLLLGRSFHDGDGDYTVVVAAVSPPSFTSTPGHFHVDHHQSAAVAAAALDQHPMLDQVGWWHSHSLPSGFSHVDRAEQRSWQSPHQVGLLVFTHGDPWAVAYQGPEARPLALVTPSDTGSEPADAAQRSSIRTEPERADQLWITTPDDRGDGDVRPAPHPEPPTSPLGGWGDGAAPVEDRSLTLSTAFAVPPIPDDAPTRRQRVGWWWWAAIGACVTASVAFAGLAAVSH